MRRAALAVLTALAAAALTAAARDRAFGEGGLVQVHRDFARDPGWEGVRNRLPVTFPPRVMQRFGWSPTNHAGAAAGEIGGYIQSSTRPATYAKAIEPRTLDAPLSFSGSFALLEGRSISGWHTLAEANIGFFNAAEQGWRPKSFAGFRLAGSNEPDGALIEIGYGTRTGAAGGAFLEKTGLHEGLVKEIDGGRMLRIAPGAARHRFACAYDPAAGGGRGEIRLTLDGRSWSLPLREGHRKAGGTLDRFGIFNQQIPGRALVVYLDDLEVNGEREDFAADPRWEGRGNDAVFEDPVLYGSNDFGYSPTAYAGGERGEIGGRFWRVDAGEPQLKGHYGDDVGRLTLDDRLEARGKIAIRRFSIDSGILIGFFDSAAQGWPPRSFAGAYLDSLTSGGRFFMPMYGTVARGEHLHPERSPFFIDDGKPQELAILYDPEAAGGSGAVTVALGSQSATLPLPAAARREGASMNRFGVFNMQDSNGKHCEVYLDDLTYTSSRAAAAPGEGVRAPFELGGGRFLFLDDLLLEEVRGAEVRVNPPRPAGLVLIADRPWERGGITSYGNVLWDPQAKEIRLYYVPVCWDVEPGFGLALATSEDGIRWRKPDLGAVEWKGSRDNNLVLWGQREGTVIIDPNAPAERRYACISSEPSLKTRLFTSPDGIHFTMHPEPISPLHSDSQISTFWDADARRYMHYPRRVLDGLRAVGFVAAARIDEPWPAPEAIPVVMARDERDPPELDLYTNAAQKYAPARNAYVAFPTPYYHHDRPEERRHLLEPTLARGGKSNDGTIETQLAVSHDGRSWKRHRVPYVPLGTYDGLDVKIAMVLPGIVERGRLLHQYFAGYTFTHGDTRVRYGRGGRELGGIFRLEQRIDGFTSLDFDYEGGEVITAPFAFAGRRLVLNVNASASGEGRVAILDSAGAEIEGFGLADARCIHGDGLETVVSWRDAKTDVSVLAGRPVRLKLAFRGSKLYSFQFTE
ncbi:MAG: hypothetical protein HY721_14870 [Planctomycetes bacterium]|nr:hypothetical protein [Planctomycetota bacterium]